MALTEGTTLHRFGRAGAMLAVTATLLTSLVLAAQSAGAAVPTKVIPFTSASATLESNGTYDVSWAASSSAGAVHVFAANSSAAQSTTDQVGKGASTGSITVSGLAPAAPRWYFTLSPAHGSSLVVAERSLGMAAVPNLRDVGDYRTGDGQWVRPGVVYRSGQLSAMTATDQQTFQQLNTTEVVDLRTSTEQAAAPDALPSGTTLVNDNVLASNTAIYTSIETDTANLIEHPTEAVGTNSPASLLSKLYVAMVTLPSARTAYATLYKDIAALPAGDTLDYHCTAGKDRTGWGTAALLLELGVPKQTVMNDYLLSNTYVLPGYESVLQSYQAKGGNPAVIRPVLGVAAQFLNTSLATVTKEYGSINGYFTKGLGLNAKTIAELRAKLLTGQPTS
jgi:protein-tyrosine phosphatase